MLARTRIFARMLAAGLCLAIPAPTVTAQPTDNAKRPARPSLRLDIFEATEVLLRDVCLAGILDRKPIAELAQRANALPVAAKSYGAGADEKAYRLGPITRPVYAITWADGSCTTRVERGDSEKLRALAEGIILARSEGFIRGSHTAEDGGRVVRTVYCVRSGSERLVASITTPGKKMQRGTMALSSTIYRAKGTSALCEAGGRLAATS